MIISIETSTSDLSLTLLSKESILSHISIPIKNELSEIIVPTIKMFLQDNSISFCDVCDIGCNWQSILSVCFTARY